MLEPPTSIGCVGEPRIEEKGLTTEITEKR
jgi:hypothetical protein